ncbi:MAG: recombinase family protein [Clostridium sp.]|uniref:recombinase family protein n=1 Tax=Clostridium sp. TaxID=1506 RepID=UPI003EE71D4E
MAYYNYKLTYSYEDFLEKHIQYFGREFLMNDYIEIGKKRNLKVLKIEEVKGINAEISELLAKEILESSNKSIKCEVAFMQIIANRENREIVINAVGKDNQKPVNLFTKPFERFRALLGEVGIITPGKDGEIIVSLKKTICDTYDTKNKINNVYGYCRISTKGQLENNSLEQQKEEIEARYNNASCYDETYTGKTMDRPIFNKILNILVKGDTLVVTKLDRLCRSTREGLEIIEKLKEKGIRIHILNMGLIEDTPMGNLIVTNLLAFAEFERAMIVERTQAGKAIAKTKEDFREGRPKKFTKKQVDHALSLLSVNGGDKSYKEVEEITEISKSTLIRAMRNIKNK